MGEKTKEHTVLIVDDDHHIRVNLRHVLEDEGYRVASATNGREALDLLDRTRPCVMLLDLKMPLMDGWEFAAALGQNAEWSAIPIVIISAYLGAARIPQGIRPIACLDKPILLDTLLAAVSKVCD